MADWRQYVDNFLVFNERPLLKGNGKVGHEQMVKIAYERYEEFDAQRRQTEALQADANDISKLTTLSKLSAGGNK